MEEPNINSEPENNYDPNQASRTSKRSLWMGILAILPYLSLILGNIFWNINRNYLLNHPIDPNNPTFNPGGYFYIIERLSNFFLSFGLWFGFIFGFVFGLLAITNGLKGLKQTPNMNRNMTFSRTGILLGIGGIIGNIWFYVTCQMCS